MRTKDPMTSPPEILERSGAKWRTVFQPRKLGLFEPVPDGMLPRGLPQTRFGVYFAMLVVFGWFVVFACIAIPVLYCCFWLFAAIFGFI